MTGKSQKNEKTKRRFTNYESRKHSKQKSPADAGLYCDRGRIIL